MADDDPVRLCLDELRGSDEVGAARGAGRLADGPAGCAGAVRGRVRLGVLDEENERVRQAADEDDHDLYRVVDKWLDMFPARMEERREGWALTMVRGAYILKSAGDGDWRSFAATAMALLDGRTLKTVPILDRIYAETVMAMLRENVGRLSEGDDGTAELGQLTAAAAWPENGGPVAPSIWLDGYLAAGVLAPSEARPDALYSAAVERFPDGSGGPGPEAFLTYMTNRYEVLQAQYGETNAVQQ